MHEAQLAVKSVPEFKNLHQKLERHIVLTGKSKSTLTNYGRCLATMALHFQCNPLDLDKEQVFDYLHHLKSQSTKPSQSYFKHTVYGLSLAYKVLSVTPQLLKHRLILGMLYGCGLRRFEILNIKLQDVDFDRKMLHIREEKGRKYPYVHLGEHLTRGLKSYIGVEHPYVWLFNGKATLTVLIRCFPILTRYPIFRYETPLRI